MDAFLPILLPLLSALIYVFGALFLKGATDRGAGTWRIARCCNVVTALVFAPLVLFGGTLPSWTNFWQPALVALLFVAGQVFTFRSLQVGDVSVATPVLGIKIVLVAFLTTVLLRDRLTPSLWLAAILSTLAIALLNLTSGKHRRVGMTIVFAGLAAAAYALFDVLVQRWSPVWGMGRFLPVMMGFVALSWVPMRWLDRNQMEPLERAVARPWLIGGAVCLALQSVLFVSTLALYGGATVANVLYSSRGLWSVLAVWAVGHWFQNREQHLGARILFWRFCGAALLLIAIVLVLVP